jgi:hypothetical protein
MNKSKFYKVGGRASMISGVVIFFGFSLGVGLSAIIFNNWRVAILASRYTEEIFIVDSVEFGKSTKRRSADMPIATGTVNGRNERIGLRGFDFEANSLGELQDAFPSGAHVSILYDPSASEVFTQGKTLRVIPASTDLKNTWVKALAITLLPLSLLLAGGIGQLRCIHYRRSQSKPARTSREMRRATL